MRLLTACSLALVLAAIAAAVLAAAIMPEPPCAGEPSPDGRRALSSSPCFDEQLRRVGTAGAMVWSDEFNWPELDGGPNPTRWSYELSGDGRDESGLARYANRTTDAVGDGELRIVAQCEAHEGYNYTSARLTTQNKGDFSPGHRIEVRARLPTGAGARSSVSLLPTNGTHGDWPRSGAIDVIEKSGCEPGRARVAYSTEAYNRELGTQGSSSFPLDDGWHTHTLVWRENALSYFVDDTWLYTYVRAAEAPDRNDSSLWPFDERFHLSLSIAVGGSAGSSCLGGAAPSCDDPTQLGEPQVLRVDYVRVYVLKEKANACSLGANATDDANAERSPELGQDDSAITERCVNPPLPKRVLGNASRFGPKGVSLAHFFAEAFWTLNRVASSSLGARVGIGAVGLFAALVALLTLVCARWGGRLRGRRASAVSTSVVPWDSKGPGHINVEANRGAHDRDYRGEP
jgi:beta-glucanase (GH16 family)